MPQQILVNKIQTPDGTILESRHRHDYVSCLDTTTGEWYSTDGGLDYIRRSINSVPAKELDVFVGDQHTKIREEFRWGSYGIDGKGPKVLITLKDLTNEHIEAILSTQWQTPDFIRDVFLAEVDFRKGLDV